MIFGTTEDGESCPLVVFTEFKVHYMEVILNTEEEHIIRKIIAEEWNSTVQSDGKLTIVPNLEKFRVDIQNSIERIFYTTRNKQYIWDVKTEYEMIPNNPYHLSIIVRAYKPHL